MATKINPLNYNMLKRVFFNHPHCAKFLFNVFDIHAVELIDSEFEEDPLLHAFAPLASFELNDTSSVLIFHDANAVFINIFAEGVLVKIDEMLMKIFEKAYNSVFHISQKIQIDKLHITFFSKKHLFSAADVFVHEYNSIIGMLSEKTFDMGGGDVNADYSESLNDDSLNSLDNKRKNSMFDHVKIKIIELKKGFSYSQNNLAKILCGFLSGSVISMDDFLELFCCHFHEDSKIICYEDHKDWLKYEHDDLSLELHNKSKKYSYSQAKNFQETVDYFLSKVFHNSYDRDVFETMIKLINPLLFSNEDLMGYYDSEARRSKLLNVQQDAFEEGVKLGNYEGQINTAYLIKSLLSEGNVDIDDFLTNLCCIKPQDCVE